MELERVLEDAATCGIIIQEVLQGVQPSHYISEVRRSLLSHFYLETPLAVYEKAADYARRCREKGISLTTVDAFIAAVSTHHKAFLWTADKDFMRAARIIPIRLYDSS